MGKIVITGGLGFIGSFLVRKFLNSGYKVLNLDNKTYASIKNLNFMNSKYIFKKVDIANPKKTFEVLSNFKPDFVINCAAESHVDNSIKNPSIFLKSNVNGTFNLLEATRFLQKKKKIRYLQVSTDEVYGSLEINRSKFSEKTSYNPKSPYSASKAAADHLVRSYGNTYDLDYIITNCSNNFGPFQNPEKLLPKVILSCIKRKSIPVYGNGKNIREWIYVENHCDGIKLTLEKGKTQNTYLIGSNYELSNIQIINKICDIFSKKNNFNYRKLITFVKDRPGHDLRYSLNSKKISKELNFKNNVNFEKGIKNTIDFYEKNHKKLRNIFKNI